MISSTPKEFFGAIVDHNHNSLDLTAEPGFSGGGVYYVNDGTFGGILIPISSSNPHLVYGLRAEAIMAFVERVAEEKHFQFGKKYNDYVASLKKKRIDVYVNDYM